jgi:carbohydrate-selective porin OprB
LFGDWCGERTRLEKRGVRFDFQYVSDTLWGFKSQQNSQFASWNRFRATVDVDFGKLAGQDGLYFHATGLAQGGGNLGQDLGLLTGPSSLASFNTTRLDSWWVEKRWLDDRIAIRVGQFAGQDFYGNAQYGESFINGPMGYALGNLSTTFETANPFATPAAEIRIVPIDHLYLKSMVMAGDPSPLTSNPTGLVPTFRGNPVVVSEIGFTPGRNATSRATDDVENRKGYSGLYQFGVAYNPGDFTAPLSPTPVSGNYLLYWKASQALWRVDPKQARGLDAIFAIDWSPPNVNRNFMQLTAGLRFNEPLPLGFHNSISLGYVRNSLSSDFLPAGMAAWKIEHGVEVNMLLNYGPFLVQPVLQYYANVGGIGGQAVVAGFRTKIDF